MLILKDVTLKYDGQLILHNCNGEIAHHSIIVAKNDMNTDILAKALSGFHALTEGEISLTENFVRENEIANKNVFFVITEDFHKLWKNYRVADIPKLLKMKFNPSVLCNKYDIPQKAPFEGLTKFQRLIYLISIGQALKRVVFVFDQPTKYFDYDDLRRFNEFLNDEFLNQNYVIITNRFDEISSRETGVTYHIDCNTIKIFERGDRKVGIK